DARAGEDAETLAMASRGEGIDHAHAEIDFAPDASASVRRRRRAAQPIRCNALRDRALAVDRFAERVDDAAEPTVRRMQLRRFRFDIRLATHAHAVELREGQHQRVAVAEPDNL